MQVVQVIHIYLFLQIGNGYLISIEISTEIFEYCDYIPDDSTTTTTTTGTDTSTDTSDTTGTTDATGTTDTTTDTTTSTSTDTVLGNSELIISTNCTNWFL